MLIIRTFDKTHIVRDLLKQTTLCGEPIIDETPEFPDMNNIDWEIVCEDCRCQIYTHEEKRWFDV